MSTPTSLFIQPAPAVMLDSHLATDANAEREQLPDQFAATADLDDTGQGADGQQSERNSFTGRLLHHQWHGLADRTA